MFFFPSVNCGRTSVLQGALWEGCGGLPALELFLVSLLTAESVGSSLS